MAPVRLQVGVLVVALAASAGCTRVFRGKATQPNPLSKPNETLRQSEQIVIITGDMELEMPSQIRAGGGQVQVNKKYPLQNTASFTVVSRDRLRFHVQIEHKWEEWADLGSWSAFIENSEGKRFVPETIENRAPHHVVHMWDFEKRSVHRSYGRRGDIVFIRDDGWKDRQHLGNISVFRGRGDYVFHARDIFTPNIKWIKLVVKRNGVVFTFMWKFVDPDADVSAVDVGHIARR